MRKLMSMCVVLVLVVGMLSGCSRCATTAKWAAGSGLAGAAIGAAFGPSSSERCENAAIGAGAGIITGALIGHHIEKYREINDMKAQLKAKDEEIARLNKKIKDLEDEIANLKKQLAECQKNVPLSITILDGTLFNSGKRELKAEGKTQLDKVAAFLNKCYPDRKYVVQGHTDNVPIKHSGYQSNWELGAARALTTMHYLIKKGIAPEKMSAQTFGEYKPRCDNSSKENRAQNRRSVIVILPTQEPEMKEVKAE
jgi:flagellar motor protein MotB